MDVLVLGGTGFLGGAVTDAAVAAGHRVAVLTRGETRRVLPAGVEALVADRHGDLSFLAARSFDLIVDTCAYTPDAVAALHDTIGFCGRYALVSSISVYSDFGAPGRTEDAPANRATTEQRTTTLALPPDQRSSAAALGPLYGPMKRECELEAIGRFGDRALILRVGLLVGAGDYTDRFTYWVRRVDRGGAIPCPGDPTRPVQVIDVRDVAAWVLHATNNAGGGVFNVTGRPVPMAALLDICRRAANSDARFVWVREEDVLAAGLAPWTEVPLWLPQSDTTFRHIMEVGVQKARAAGLRTRPIHDTVDQILACDRARRGEPLKAGMPADKEGLLLMC